jgi:probable phosphoglycerate mutase
MSLSVVVEADGGARGNPGPAGYGAVVRDAATGEVLAERLGALGIATNNVAEYSGLIAGLTAAVEVGADDVEVRMDSKLVVEQMAGRWKIKHPGLRPLAARAAALVRRFSSVRFTWIPREHNKHADALANAAMDGKAAPEEPSPAADPVAAAPVIAGRSWEPQTGTPTRLILVRHAETDLTAQRRYSGRGDASLTARGHAQAKTTAARVAGLGRPVAAVLTSPLSRCVHTAEVIATALGDVPVRPEPDLVECDFGAWEGLTFAEVRTRWPDEFAAWLASSTVAPPGGEAFTAVAARTRRVVARVLVEYRGETVVVVSHVSPLKLILRDALAGSDAFLHRCYLDPAGVSIVDSWPDGGVAVRTVNDTAHLSE